MQLLSDKELAWSPVVANNRMNRERNASGINSYEKEFSFKPELFLENRILRNGKAAWLDLCCGKGNALIQAADYFAGKQLQDAISLVGIDLLDAFAVVNDTITCLRFKTTALADWQPAGNYDLITCSHGLHYIGDKLSVIEKAIAALTPDGLFIANLDLTNIRIDQPDSALYFKTVFRQLHIEYNSRKKIIQKNGQAPVQFGLPYLGADDSTGPNYTGQEAVTSYYIMP
jgi:SAM-dependent methyltransferase